MMKKFLKSLSLVMALVMCFTMVFTAAVSADGATPTITFGVKDSVEPGTVSITVDAANFADVAGVQGEITVGGLTDAAVVAGTIDNVVIDAGVISFAREGEANDEGTKITMADGTLFTITGTAVEGTNITLAWTADETKACDTAEVLLDLSYANKTVEVKAAVVGPTLDENITVDASILVDSTLGVMYVLNGLDSYADWDIVVTKSAYSTTDYNVITSSETITKAQMTPYKGSYYAYSYGFALTDLCLDVTAVVNCYDAEGNKINYSNTVTKTLKTLADEGYAKSTASVALKTVLTDLLNMGAEAQAYFAAKYPSSALAAVAEENYPNVGFDQTYATAEVGNLTLGAGQTANTGATISAYGTILQSPALGFIVKTASTPSDLKIELSYYNAYTKKDVVIEVDPANITEYKGSYYYNYYDLPLYSSNAVLTLNVFDGETALGTYTYTVEQYVSENLSNADLTDVLSSIAKFGVSARAYFNM